MRSRSIQQLRTDGRGSILMMSRILLFLSVVWCTLLCRVSSWSSCLPALGRSTCTHGCGAYYCSSSSCWRRPRLSLLLLHGAVVPPGADIEQPTPSEAEAENAAIAAAAITTGIGGETTTPRTGSDIPTSTSAVSIRGKVNEIDFCIAPADVSLSRAYGTTVASPSSGSSDGDGKESSSPVGLSLTRALNNASNRAVRRILLARSWPSAEALNLSLRQAAAMEAARLSKAAEEEATQTGSSSGSKCPVPRPILNVLTRNQQQNAAPATGDDKKNKATDDNSGSQPKNKKKKKNQPKPRSRTDEEYVADQLRSFQELYGSLPGYAYAQDYLECILSLATAGVESPKARSVLSKGIYDEAYRRVLSVLKSVGVQFVPDIDTKRLRIASKLRDKDICLSILDKIKIRQEASATANGDSPDQQDGAPAAADKKINNENQKEAGSNRNEKSKNKGMKFWKKDDVSDEDDTEITNEDLGGVLLSAKEPTMTRQLNVLSNIVQRALLFGGDEELLVLAETLDADRSAFIDHWYPGTKEEEDEERESREGVRYLNCLIRLLRKCYDDGVVTDLAPPLVMASSYANAYDRLVASAVELGSGYLKPRLGITSSATAGTSSSSSSTLKESGSGSSTNVANLKSMPKPRTAQEELGRFAVWESKFRQQQSAASSSTSSSGWEEYSPYPEDLVGMWEVRDVIGGETIGSSQVTFLEGGNVQVAPPLEGLRWRLDPGPTHLDTCTFQVVSTLDGTILQYRGFIDRGARLEARFSKRPIQLRGSVMFQMREGGAVDYYKDILPINYRTGTTKFVMTRLQQ